MQQWLPTPYRRNKDDLYADVPGVGPLHIRRRKGGFRLVHRRELIGQVYPDIEAAKAAGEKFITTFAADGSS